MSKKITVLYIFHEAMSSGGATYSGMNMIKSLDKTKIYPIVMVPEEGDIKEKMEAIGVKCIVAPVDFMFRSHDHTNLVRRCAHCYKRLKAHIKSFVLDCKTIDKEIGNIHVDIVHSNTAAILTGFVLSKYLHCKHVWHLREFIDKDFQEKPYLGFWLMRKCINAADATISITNAVKKHWIRSKTKNTFQIFNAVKSVSSLNPINFNKEKYFLFCANLVEKYKGADLAMEGFCKSAMYKKRYKLVYVGNYRDEYKEELLEKAKEVGAENLVEFVGYCKDTTSYYAKATAFLMCSENEAMGRTTIEAFWNGCPVLGRNTGGTPELVKNGETGYLFDTVEQLANLMVLITKEDNSHVIECAREFAICNFTEEGYGKKVEKVYRTILKQQ